MKTNEIPMLISSETKRLVIAMADARTEKLQAKRDAMTEINRIKRLINAEEDKIARGKAEIKRIRDITKGINTDLGCMTNLKIAEKMEVSLKKVNNILSNRSSIVHQEKVKKVSQTERQNKIVTECEKRNSPEYKSTLKAAL